MIDDRERIGIVELLRDEADYWRDYNKDDDTLCMSDSDFTECVLEAFGFDGTVVPVYEVFDKLADLVDRPPCRNLAVKPADEFLCSKCGEHVDIAYMDSCDDYHAKYCPNCGERVVSDAV